MARLSSFSLFAFALSKLVIASPLVLPRQFGFAPGNGSAPVAPGTIVQGCTQFFTVAANDSCTSIENQFNISDILFKTMNPEIDAACDNLMDGSSYCVQTSNLTNIPSNVSPGTITAGCVRYFTVQPDTSCITVSEEADITVASFLALNPQVNSACLNLIAGEAYCVDNINMPIATGPPNVAPGTITAGCTQFFTVQNSQTCDEVEAMFNISSALFMSLNPEINALCTNLIAGDAYCVGGTPPS